MTFFYISIRLGLDPDTLRSIRLLSNSWIKNVGKSRDIGVERDSPGLILAILADTLPRNDYQVQKHTHTNTNTQTYTCPYAYIYTHNAIYIYTYLLPYTV